MTNHRITQKVHGTTVLGYIGLLLHVPVVMAIVAILVALVYEEYFAIIPFVKLCTVALVFGQVLYRLFYKACRLHLWDAMLVAALSWLVFPLFAAIPFYYIAKAAYTLSGNVVCSELVPLWNTLFESFSACTSTGLSLVARPEKYPYSLLFWRSLTCWVGGSGLILFVLMLMQPGKEEYRLYYAEAHSDAIGTDVQETAKIIWILYSTYTFIGAIAYYIAGMPLFAAINHAMTSISTGGFTVTSTSFAEYSAEIKSVGIVLMMGAATSFAVHYRALQERSLLSFVKEPQHLLFFTIFMLACGGSLLVGYFDGFSLPALDAIFNAVSALTTCGFSASTLINYPPNLVLILTLAMLIGGCSGSSAGGIKVQRLKHLAEGVQARISSISDERERYILESLSKKGDEKARFGLPMGPSAEKWYAAGILLTMWIATLFLGWFLLLFAIKPEQSFAGFFEVVSAMSNAGLAMGIMNPDFASFGKFVYIFLMWAGRIELLPAFVLAASALLVFRRKQAES